MEEISRNNQDRAEISIKDQIKKFAIDSLYGFNTIILIGIGRKLGIFDYLYEKTKSISKADIYNVAKFTLDELAERLNLDVIYLDAWLHLALECGLFEIDDLNKKSLKTAPFVYDLLIDHNHISYIGGTLGAFYNIALAQEIMLKNFKTGKTMDLLKLPGDVVKDLQERSRRFGKLIEKIFTKSFTDFCKNLNKQGSILEVGCGYGFNIETWAKVYEKARFVGTDIDPNGIKFAQKLVDQNKWNERIKIYKISTNEYARNTKDKFNLIILNQVLHEMNPNEKYRRQLFKDLYLLLNDKGILLIGESVVPDTFAPKEPFKLYDITHKFSEAGSSRFYNEKTFKTFLDSTPFTKAEFIKEKGIKFWVIRK
ncbi:MAG: class I SAM-dependent methyltransferase [Candidatus Lokiarchaeota archaeon]|nr:class I SAM-dependent methyltransferase [Candidatus Lokiarchaeota archaeon]